MGEAENAVSNHNCKKQFDYSIQKLENLKAKSHKLQNTFFGIGLIAWVVLIVEIIDGSYTNFSLLIMVVFGVFILLSLYLDDRRKSKIRSAEKQSRDLAVKLCRSEIVDQLGTAIEKIYTRNVAENNKLIVCVFTVCDLTVAFNPHTCEFWSYSDETAEIYKDVNLRIVLIRTAQIISNKVTILRANPELLETQE